MKNYTKDFENKKPKHLLVGFLISVIMSALMIFLFAFILTACDLSADFASPLSSLALGLGGAVGSFYSAKRIGEKGYLWGLALALILFCFNMLISFILNGAGFSSFAAIRLVVVLIMSMLGGILGINKKSRSLVK